MPQTHLSELLQKSRELVKLPEATNAAAAAAAEISIGSSSSDCPIGPDSSARVWGSAAARRSVHRLAERPRSIPHWISGSLREVHEGGR